MTHRQRRVFGFILIALAIGAAVLQPEFNGVGTQTRDQPVQPSPSGRPEPTQVSSGQLLAREVLETLPVKGRAPRTGYERTQFGDGWKLVDGCDTRNIILHRDLVDTVVDDKCKVLSGKLHDPYTGKDILFIRGDTTSDDVQIDHVVALSNAWQTGAQQLTPAERVAFANDPLELAAVDGPANQAKGDGDAATWLPPYKPFRCQYIARQIAVKSTYRLWVTPAERDAMRRVLGECPDQRLPSPALPLVGN